MISAQPQRIDLKQQNPRNVVPLKLRYSKGWCRVENTFLHQCVPGLNPGAGCIKAYIRDLAFTSHVNSGVHFTSVAPVWT